MDDIVIGSVDFKEHLDHILELMEDVRKAGIKLNLKKTQLCKQELEFVGHWISMYGIKPMENKLRKIHEMERPKTLKQL